MCAWGPPRWRAKSPRARRGAAGRGGARAAGRGGGARAARGGGLDRFVARRYGRGPAGTSARLVLRFGLALWVPLTWLLERVTARRRSTTGERTRAR
jgi:hypothetical protein